MDEKAAQIEAVLAAVEKCANLTKVCKRPGMPNKSTFLLWVDSDPALADQYARARARGIESEFEDMTLKAERAKDAQLGRLAWDAKRWYLSKIAPKKYGEKVEIEHTGEVRVEVLKAARERATQGK